MQKRKLIEVALPLEAINRASLAEKNRKVGKPQNLHHWWSRKPITAARAMLLAQLIDDPSSDPDRFPTEGAVRAERERLHQLIAQAVEWDEVTKPSSALKTALRPLLPDVTVTDPFVGGGSIPLAAAQLGVNSCSSDLNPVAVLLTKALVEVPSRFVDYKPVHPDSAAAQLTDWNGLHGLAADIEAYGRWMHSQAAEHLRPLFPAVDGYPTLAWVWARTAACRNPVCRIDVPLVSKWWLAKKAGREAIVVPQIVTDPSHISGLRFSFSISHDVRDIPKSGIMSGRTGTECLSCGAPVPVGHVRNEGLAGRMGMTLIAIVADGGSKRLYYAPTDEHVAAANVARPVAPVSGDISSNPRWFSPPLYGLTDFSDLFTNRQLKAMAIFSGLIADARQMALKDALRAGMGRGETLVRGGSGAEAYADAIGLYLALAVSRLADWSNNQCKWEANGEVSQHLYTAQAMDMAWDISEANVLGDGNSGSFLACLKSIINPLRLARPGGEHRVRQFDARHAPLANCVVATDPPYFDNIDYSDLSDFFYVWQRHILGQFFPDLFRTMLVPKVGELVANAHRCGGSELASREFLKGFVEVFGHIRENVSPEFPIVVYYASKQAESVGGGNSRWSTILQAMVDANWQVVRTWPIRTENVSRRVAIGNNSMTTSTVLVLRPRGVDAPRVSFSTFLDELRTSLSRMVSELQSGGVAPVDLQQAAIGPGMAVFSQYGAVLEADGSPMTVSSALVRINEALDEVINEEEGDFDAPTRFAIQWYRYNGYTAGPFGDADDIARGRNTSVDTMEREGLLIKRAGRVELLSPIKLPEGYDAVDDPQISQWEVLHHSIRALESEGITTTGRFLQRVMSRADGGVDPEMVRELAHLLFRIAEDKRWTKDALSFNTLVTSWPEILKVARTVRKPAPAQAAFDFEDDE
ncbi:DUF1156 domain-containing protein [Nocardia sp. NPDC050793]|uniref:DUF1156 domain-containing protein n=1 Tax=Nocardia sp. NPDC050793 TaxID=3155159 RepID=UPI0033C8A123